MDKSGKYELDDFRNLDPWRIFRIMAEFVDGFESMAKVDNGVSVFGSARTPPGDPYYAMAVELGRELSVEGFTVITGGGPGIMEAANKGAREVNGESIGLNIDLPFEQKPNPFISKALSFRYFFCRKVMFSKYSIAIVAFPGGFGTMDELFEHLTLVQTMKIPPMPIILVGSDFWNDMISWIKKDLLGRRLISHDDLNLYHLVDTAGEVMDILRKECPQDKIRRNAGK